jgi:carbon-monoxide dehydrogenase medium subunit
MIPAAFDYVRANSLAQAIGLLRDNPDGNKIVAGGHTLLPTLKLRLASPETLIDISRIDELKGVVIGDDGIKIGALTRHAELLANEPLHEVLPIFRQAASVIADPQVRNRGTIGGSLANADPSADWPAVILALRAELELAGPDGHRRVAAKDFFIDMFTTALAAGEVIVAIHVPRLPLGTRSCYRKIRHPASGYAVVGVAAVLRQEAGVVVDASIGVTGATAYAFSATAATDVLIGKPLTADTVKQASELAVQDAACLADHYASADYRRHLLQVQTARALTSLADDA